MNSLLKRALGPWTAGAVLLAGMVPAVWAQAPLGWQEANHAVGQFPRGHADLLRWEQKHMPQSQEAPASAEAGSLTLERAVRLAMQDEAAWVRPGMSEIEVAAVRQQVAALRLDVHRRWVDAVAARQSLAHSRDILAVAQAGAELGQRMARVGNWSRARQIQEELALWDASARVDQARLQADRALQALWQRIGAGMGAQALAQQLPLHLPQELPVHWPGSSSAASQASLALDDVPALQQHALQAHARWSLQDLSARRQMAGLGLSDAELQAAQKTFGELAGREPPVWDPRALRWGHAFENAWQARLQADRLARQVRADVQMAAAAYRMARQNAQQTQAQVLRLHTELAQETLLRYNGMLKSTWDLLASARSRIDSVDAALQAQRQAWLAHADLMGVLAGLPYVDSTGASGAASPSNTRTAGH